MQLQPYWNISLTSVNRAAFARRSLPTAFSGARALQDSELFATYVYKTTAVAAVRYREIIKRIFCEARDNFYNCTGLTGKLV